VLILRNPFEQIHWALLGN